MRLPDEIPVSGDSETRKFLLDKNFGHSECTTCGKRFVAEFPFTYLDRARGHFFSVHPSSKLKDWLQSEFQFSMQFEEALGEGELDFEEEEKYLRRLVFGHGQLREKLLLWEYGLDDRIVELAKHQALMEAPLSLRDSGHLDLTLDRIDLKESAIWFRAQRLNKPLEPELIYISLRHYHDLQTRQEELEEFYPELFQQPFVNALRYLLLD